MNMFGGQLRENHYSYPTLIRVFLRITKCIFIPSYREFVYFNYKTIYLCLRFLYDKVMLKKWNIVLTVEKVIRRGKICHNFLIGDKKKHVSNPGWKIKIHVLSFCKNRAAIFKYYELHSELHNAPLT